MSPLSKAKLAREHFTRASAAFEAEDPVVGVTFLHLAAEAAIVALAEMNGVATDRQHWRKGQAAIELHARDILSVDLSPVLELLNQARKDAGYEGEEPSFGDWTPAELLSTVEEAVRAAEDAMQSVEDGSDLADHATQSGEDVANAEEDPVP